MIQVAPSLLSCDFTRMGEELAAITREGADLAHLDVMDGDFVPNITFGIPVIAALRGVSKIPFDVHLMISEPIRYADRFIDAGADILTVHIEACRDVAATLSAIRARGVKAGLSVKPNTPWEAVIPYLPLCDLILVMTVEPGFGGQALIPECLDKVTALRRYCADNGFSPLLEVDGGINEKTAADAIRAGSDILVAGSYVFRAKDRAAVIAGLKSIK